MSSCFWSTVWVVPGEPVNLLFQNYIHQVGQKVLFSNTCCCTLVFSPSNSALRIMCRADPVTHMRATVYSPCNKLAAPQALRCWQAKTRSDEHLWQKVLTCLLCQARKKNFVSYKLLCCCCGLLELLGEISSFWSDRSSASSLMWGAWKMPVNVFCTAVMAEVTRKPETGFTLSLSERGKSSPRSLSCHKWFQTSQPFYIRMLPSVSLSFFISPIKKKGLQYIITQQFK